MINNPIYSGISFPPRRGAGYGFFDITVDDELLKNNIYVILNTKKGSMPMNYEFGSSAHDLLFEPINEVTQGLIADLIKADIERWEPRVEVASIKAASLENTRIFELILKTRATGQLVNTTVSFSA
jgi:phage baseplate assembly protein W